MRCGNPHGGDIYTNKNCIDFSANINFMGMPDAVRKAARESIDASIHYPDVECRELKAAIAGLEKISSDFIFCGNGAADVLLTLVQAVRPQKALLAIPTFHEYEKALNSVGCSLDTYFLKEETGFVLQEDFIEYITADTDMIFLCNPNNPTGILIGKKLMELIIYKCQQTDTFLVIDECFMDLIPEPEHYSMVRNVERNPHVFVLKAFTKTYAMPGLRLGYGLCSDRVILEKMEAVSQPWRVSVPAQAAGTAAVKETAYVLKSRCEIKRLREKMMYELMRMGYTVFDSQANYIFFKGEIHLEKKLLEKGFLIRDCSNFRGLSAGYYRIAVRNEEENEALLLTAENRPLTSKGRK